MRKSEAWFITATTESFNWIFNSHDSTAPNRRIDPKRPTHNSAAGGQSAVRQPAGGAIDLGTDVTPQRNNTTRRGRRLGIEPKNLGLSGNLDAGGGLFGAVMSYLKQS